MKKNIISSIGGRLALLALLAAPIFASCAKCECEPYEKCDCEPYDDTALRNEIKALQARVAALEQSVSENVEALQSMISLGSIASCAYDAETGKAVLILVDGNVISFDCNVTGTTLMTVMLDADGRYYWAVCTDGKSSFLEIDGKKVPVAVTPELKISDEGEWLISVDGGATWVQTGIFQKDLETDDEDSGEGTDQTVEPAVTFFKDVMVYEDYLYLTLADDSVIKLAVTGEASFSAASSQLSFNAPGQEKSVELRMNNVRAYTITEKPEGWKARIEESYLYVTAPEDPASAASDGTVKILALFDAGVQPEIVSVKVVYKEQTTEEVPMFSEIMFDSARLHIDMGEFGQYYAGFSETGFWESVGRDNVLESLSQDGMAPVSFPFYDGPVNAFPDGVVSAKVLPSTDYMIWIMPVKEDKKYAAEDFIIYGFTTFGISSDPSIPAPSHKITDVTYGGFTAEVTPASGTYKTYAAIRKASSIPEDEAASVAELISINNFSTGSSVLTVSSNSFSEDDEVCLLSVSITEDGKYGKVLKEQVPLKTLEYSTDIAVEVTGTAYGMGDVTLTLGFTGSPATISYYYATYSYYTDDVMQDLLARGQLGDAVNDKPIASLTDGNRICLSNLVLGTQYTFYALVKDADGKPSRMITSTFIPTNTIEYVKSTDPEYSYGMPQLSGTKSGTTYTLTVDMPAECTKYWLFFGNAEYFTGDVYTDTDKLVTMQLELLGETVNTASISSKKYTGVYPYSRFYMAWLDDKGQYHAIYEFNPNK